eukprot:gb/GECG01011523.1/.p1 GENE.gb/GECG01011523.1/~~gb/GECG01011523.1/.p1  ORF type:complete len:132 (+),score=6.74 gb/GECG01011523.1/:1-396(+)
MNDMQDCSLWQGVPQVSLRQITHDELRNANVAPASDGVSKHKRLCSFDRHMLTNLKSDDTDEVHKIPTARLRMFSYSPSLPQVVSRVVSRWLLPWYVVDMLLLRRPHGARLASQFTKCSLMLCVHHSISNS